MTDDIDRAQAREAEMLADALRDQTRRARKGLGAVSAQESGACGEPIPEERRDRGASTAWPARRAPRKPTREEREPDEFHRHDFQL